MPLPSTILYPASGGGGGGAGDVIGPGSSTDNAIARWSGTGGDTLQDSAVTIADTSGKMSWSSGALSVEVSRWTAEHATGLFVMNVGQGAWRDVFGESVNLNSTGQYKFSATNPHTGSKDTGLARSAAGVIRGTDGSAGIRGFIGGGTAVASAAAMPVPTGRVFHVTGTTNITSITSTNFQSGAVITLIFDDALTFTDGNNLKLAGDFVTTADDTITLAYDGTNWYEVCRSVN